MSSELLVAGIDFGTTYSGYAIQFKHEYDKNPTQIRAPQAWNGGKQNLMSYKTPTCLLLDENKKFVSFGFEAETQYADLCFEKKNEKYYYYKRFKMRLMEGQGLKRTSTLADETGKEMSALTVFAMSIECLAKHLMNMLENEGTGVRMDDVFWVLTVPAIWDDAAKAFMKEAASRANIKGNKLCIALEPEAASLCCQLLPIDKVVDGKKAKRFSDTKPGTVYLVADLGGGTADITIHEKLADNKLKEIHKPTGGPWGGAAVDDAFWQLFVSIAGGPTMSKFKKTMTYDYLDFYKDLEVVKRTFYLGMKTSFIVKFPASLNDICREKHEGKAFEDLVKESRYAQSIQFVSDKMRMFSDLVASLFGKVTENIINHIGGLLKNTEAGKRVEMILMVGGFSESPYVQEQFKAKLQTGKIKIFIPKEAGLSVLNGAVLFGRRQDTITERVLPCTYGVRVTPEFVEGKFPESKKIPGSIPRCKDVFKAFIMEGTPVERGFSVDEVYTTTIPNQKSMALNIYTCTGDVPQFVTDKPCRLLGCLEVNIPNPSVNEKHLLVRYVFGNTELIVTAVETESKKGCVAKFNFDA